MSELQSDPTLAISSYTRGEYTISTDPLLLDVDAIHGYLSRSYWATGRPLSVVVLEEHRGHGLGKWLINTVVNDPALQSIRRFMLATRDAHGLYAQNGFTPLAEPEILMERVRASA